MPVRLDSAMEKVMDAMTALSDLYLKSKETENSMRVVLEMERIEEEFTSTYEAERRFIHTQKEQSSERSDILSIDMLNRMNFSNDNEERENALPASSMDCHSGAPLHETSKMVGLESSMSPRSNDSSFHATKMQKSDVLNDLYHIQASGSTANALHLETAMHNTNIPIVSSSNEKANER